jgi:hypothetical protein
MATNNLKNKAERCIDVLNCIKDDLFDTIVEHNCFEKKKECLSKINIFNESAELLKTIFNIKERDKQ